MTATSIQQIKQTPAAAKKADGKSCAVEPGDGFQQVLDQASGESGKGPSGTAQMACLMMLLGTVQSVPQATVAEAAGNSGAAGGGQTAAKGVAAGLAGALEAGCLPVVGQQGAAQFPTGTGAAGIFPMGTTPASPNAADKTAAVGMMSVGTAAAGTAATGTLATGTLATGTVAGDTAQPNAQLPGGQHKVPAGAPADVFPQSAAEQTIGVQPDAAQAADAGKAGANPAGVTAEALTGAAEFTVRSASVAGVSTAEKAAEPSAVPAGKAGAQPEKSAFAQAVGTRPASGSTLPVQAKAASAGTGDGSKSSPGGADARPGAIPGTEAGVDSSAVGRQSAAEKKETVRKTDDAPQTFGVQKTADAAVFPVQSASGGTAAANTGAAPAKADAAGVANQIARAVGQADREGQSQIRIHLSPEDLGGINVRLVSHDGGMTLQIAADRHETGSLIASGLHELKSAMSDRGISLDHAEVQLTNDGGFSSGYSGSGGQREAASQQRAPAWLPAAQPQAAQAQPQQELRGDGGAILSVSA